MHFELTDEQKAVKELATKYAIETIALIQGMDEAEERFRPEIIKEIAELGFWGTLILEACGGSEAGFLTSVLIVEAIVRPMLVTF